MNIEDKIQALLAEAAPLRCLPDDKQANLGAIVDQINALRALQAAGKVALDDAIQQRDEAEFRSIAEEVSGIADDVDDIEALRVEAEALGIKVDRRWKESRLRLEIEAAKA